MRRRSLFIAAPFALLASASASASEKKEEKASVGQYVDIAPVALPIVVNGQLINYVFAYVRLNLNSGVDSLKMREKEPFFRDALVRAAHRTPFTKSTDYTVIDEPRLVAAMTREAAVIAGAKAVKSVVVTSQQPKRRQGMPKPKAAA